PAKWLLCLRLARPDGSRLGIARRLLRAPFSLLPLAWLPRSIHQLAPWGVVSYSPGRGGLVLRTALTASAAALSVAWAVETLRPSIGPDDARSLAQSLAASDPLLSANLGDPLEVEVGYVTRRAHQRHRGSRASFQLRILGSRGRQDMMVLARKVEGSWTVEELHDIEITMAGSALVAAR
ncbi:MAG: hypothetical protein ACE5G2_09530, partial [Candidatus Krumholzibacteriia bacterium]